MFGILIFGRIIISGTLKKGAHSRKFAGTGEMTGFSEWLGGVGPNGMAHRFLPQKRYFPIAYGTALVYTAANTF